VPGASDGGQLPEPKREARDEGCGVSRAFRLVYSC
jgi:hypothetical protein